MVATGTVVSTMQAGAEATSQKRGRAEQAIVVAREARAAVMKAVRDTPVMVEGAVGAGTAVQAALMSLDSYPPVVVAPGTLAAA